MTLACQDDVSGCSRLLCWLRRDGLASSEAHNFSRMEAKEKSADTTGVVVGATNPSSKRPMSGVPNGSEIWLQYSNDSDDEHIFHAYRESMKEQRKKIEDKEKEKNDDITNKNNDI
jgi:hypothetical protein